MLMNRLLIACAVLALLAIACAALAEQQAAKNAAAPPNRYSVIKDDRGVWWFQAPDGTRFYSLGVNNVSPEPYAPRPGTTFYDPVSKQFNGNLGDWAAHVSMLLNDHGFNTLGAWSSPVIPTASDLHATHVLYVVENDHTRCLSPLRPDFEEYVRANVRTAIGKIKHHEGVLGVFLDNEMPWYGKSGWDDIPTYTLLEQAFELPSTDIRRIKALEFLKSRHESPSALSEAYRRTVDRFEDITAAYLMGCSSAATMADREAFTAMLADRFYEVTTRIVREDLPDVLILGTRIPGNAPDAVIRACGKHCDVMSLNQYIFDNRADVNTLTRFWVLGGKPIMHTEFSWRARQNASGNPNSRGAGAILDSQADRAASYASLVADIATVPYVIASHWFEFSDQSPQGRFDGEDSNYGIVDIHNSPYTELLAAMKATNSKVHALHGSTTRAMPTELPKRKAVTYTPGQHPGRAPTLDLLGDWAQQPEIWGAPDATMSWRRADAGILLTYDSGSQYGAGINLFGPKASALDRGPAFATDLDGYSTIVLEALVPKGLQVNIVLAEAGAAPPSTPKFDTSAGDDAEAYVSIPLFGTGAIETYRLPIGGLLKQPFFGSQTGGYGIDMHAVRNLGIQVSGEPRRGEVHVRSFRLER
jgi:hypothetical protein